VDGTCTAHRSTARSLRQRSGKSQRKIHATCLPFIADFHQNGTNPSQASRFVGEDADQARASFDFAVEPVGGVEDGADILRHFGLHFFAWNAGLRVLLEVKLAALLGQPTENGLPNGFSPA